MVPVRLSNLYCPLKQFASVLCRTVSGNFINGVTFTQAGLKWYSRKIQYIQLKSPSSRDSNHCIFYFHPA